MLCKLSKIWIITLVLKNAIFFRRKSAKIAEICNHIIDPLFLANHNWLTVPKLINHQPNL
jgi:hypothetical protein